MAEKMTVSCFMPKTGDYKLKYSFYHFTYRWTVGLDVSSLNLKGTLAMSCSVRIFIVASDDTLYRIAGSRFTAMINDPESHPLFRFADQRVRMVEAIVELRNRAPCGIDRFLFEMLRFDDHGRLDIKTFLRQNFALVELISDKPATRGTVVDAGSRFVAQGGRWQPSQPLERRIRQAALGKVECKRL